MSPSPTVSYITLTRKESSLCTTNAVDIAITLPDERSRIIFPAESTNALLDCRLALGSRKPAI